MKHFFKSYLVIFRHDNFFQAQWKGLCKSELMKILARKVLIPGIIT